MSSSEWLWLIGLAGAVTYATRFSAFAINTQQLPNFVKGLAYYFPIAIIASLTLPPLIHPEGEWFLHWRNETLITAMATLGLAWLTRNLILVVCCSIALLNVLKWLSGTL